jgi:hypothetical protein
LYEVFFVKITWDSMKRLAEIIMVEYSRSHAEIIAGIIIKKPELIEELMDIVFSNNDPLSKRAAWPLRIINDRNSNLIIPYISLIVSELPKVSYVSIQRALLAILSSVKIPESCQGELLQITSGLLVDKGTPIASLIFSIEIFYNISKNELELLNELELMIEQLLPYSSAGVRSKGKKILKKIHKQQIRDF